MKDEVPISVVGKLRAREVLAAIQAHGEPDDYIVGVIVATALFMLGAVALSWEDEDKQKEQVDLFMARLPEVLDDLRADRQKAKEQNDTAD